MLTLRVVLDKTTILGVAVAPENFEGDPIGGHLQLMILNFSSTPIKAWVRRIILQPLQGVHAARKISARKIPRNSSSCFVIDISGLVSLNLEVPDVGFRFLSEIYNYLFEFAGVWIKT